MNPLPVVLSCVCALAFAGAVDAHARPKAKASSRRSATATAVAPRPPRLSLVELEVIGPGASPGSRVRKRVRVAHPEGWTGDVDPGRRSVELYGPAGEGSMLIALALHPDELGEHLAALKESHPAASPSPPMAMQVAGIDPEKGERATRFSITGREIGEMVLIERAGVIVLIAIIVDPNAWASLSGVMRRCYPTVQVIDG